MTPTNADLRQPRPAPYSFRGEPCANVAQLRLLLETECNMHGAEVSITPCAVFLREDRRRVMFTANTGRDGVVTVDPRWAEN
jgi:hypothetical protein